MLSRHGNAMYLPDPMLHKILTGNYEIGSSSKPIEPSYRFQSDSKEAFLEVDLPGVEKGNISVDVNNHCLTVTARRMKEIFLSKKEKNESKNGDAGKEEENEGKNSDDCKKEKNEGKNGNGGKKEKNESENGDGGKKEDLDEGSYLTYDLRVWIGHDADIRNISSVFYKNGVLVLRIPSQTEDNTRHIVVD